MKHVPNILSTFRILLVPVFVAVYFSEMKYANLYALGIYALACATDVLDGYIARKYNLITDLGRVLDPMGDKLMILAVMSCITIDKVIPVWALVLFVIKEFMMMMGGVVIHKIARVDMPSSNFLGKASTVVFFLVCGSLMAFRSIPPNMADMMIAIALGLTFLALGSYMLTFTAVMKERGEKK